MTLRNSPAQRTPSTRAELGEVPVKFGDAGLAPVRTVRWPRNPLGDELTLLEKHYGPQNPPALVGPFEMVLWEQIGYLAGDDKRLRAFEALRLRIGTAAASIAMSEKAALVEIASLGGIFADLRAGRILQSAAMVVEDFGGSLDSALDLPPAKAKKALQRFPMIGEPGAEKILLFCGKLDVLPLESNGLRVVTRLGFTLGAKSYSATYRAVRQATLELLPVGTAHLQQAHLLLRRHGVSTCFRAVPACHSCPLSAFCPSAAAFHNR